ncbi:MAG: PaaI family thioesterase [Coriobacteriia bacterium]|nr:PaaI family thioesterase [Coriobacteriia bacterium]
MTTEIKPLVAADASLEEVQARFSDDKFATAAGCTVVECGVGHAVCEMQLDRNLHYNGMGGVMGGAIFTLADFALAVGCNMGQAPTVSVSNTIEFLSGAKGTKLIATCTADKSGRSVAYYTVDVVDDLATKVARMVATCYRKVK